MCSCNIADQPQAFRQEDRKARKDHRCYECGNKIPAGTKYVYTSGIWDGRPDAFKVCQQCECLRDELAKIESEIAGPGELCGGPAFGNLRYMLGECELERDGLRRIKAFCAHWPAMVKSVDEEFLELEQRDGERGASES